jgi:hypothetical protein
MKRIKAIVVAAILVITGFSVQTANATVEIPEYVSFKVKGLSLKSKIMTAKQIKFIQKKVQANPYYTYGFCWVNYGSAVSESNVDKAEKLADKVCREIEKADKHYDAGSDLNSSDDSISPKAIEIYFSLEDPRTLEYYVGEASGDVPTTSSPVLYNKKITVSAKPENLENRGLEFLGWTAKNNGAGKLYLPSSKIAIKNPKTLYAKWAGYNIDVTVIDIGEIGLGHVGFNFKSPYNNIFTRELLGLVENQAFEVGGTEGAEQIWFTAPGNVSSESLVSTGDISATYMGSATCGWSLDYQECTMWYLTATGDGILTYDAVPIM